MSESETKRRKINTDYNELFKLLNINPYIDKDKKRFDGDAVIKAIQRNPATAKLTYNFDNIGLYYPLHQAIRLGANKNVIEAIYESYPQAIERGYEMENEYKTALYFSIYHAAPAEVVSFLISHYPEAVRRKDMDDNITLLHYACEYNAPYEIMSLLLNAWPDGAMEKDSYEETPLHRAFQYGVFPALDVVSLMLEHCLGVLKETNGGESTLLHQALCNDDDASLDLILFLLEKWPDAISKKDDNGDTPIDLLNEAEGNDSENYVQVRQVLSFAYKLYNGDDLDSDKLKEIMSYFIQINWKHGVLLLLDRGPTLMKHLDVDVKLIPELFSLVGNQCMMKTMWIVILNELDIMEGV